MTYDEFKTALPQLAKDYKPSADTLAKIKKLNLLIIIGPSGVGKTTVINKLGVPYVPSDTTRAPRPGEINGVDMNFLTNYDQAVADIAAGKFVQVAVGVSGDLYATRDSSYPDSGWATMPVLADVVPFFRNLGFKNTLSVFITPPNYSEWMQRMGSHNLSQPQIAPRLAEAARSFEFAFADDQTHFILNDNLAAAVQQIKELLHGQLDEDLEKAARRSAETCLKQLQSSL